MRTLGALLVRAVGVTLLLATVLLPVADHHAMSRFDDLASGQPEDVHWLLVHHHPHTTTVAADAQVAASGLASVLPAEPSPDATAATPPLAALVACLFVALVLGWRLRSLERPPPLAAFRLVPVPPPRAALLPTA